MASLEGRVERQGSQILASETYIPRTMPQVLGTFDMIAIYVAAIFFIGNAALSAVAGGVVSLTYLAIAAVAFFLPCVIATTQLGVIYPHEGSLYNWTCRALGNYWGFFAGISYWLPNVLAIVGAADGFVTYVQGLNNNWLVAPWQQGLVILAVIAITTVLGIQRMRITQNVVNGIIAATLGVVVLVAVACVVALFQHGSKTPLNNPGDWAVNWQNFPLFGFIVLLYLGTSVPMNMAGEIVHTRVITRHLLWGTLIVLVGYFICTFALLVVRGPALANDPIVPYEVVVMLDSVLGKFIGVISAVVILGFYFISPLVYNYATARLLVTASVDQRLPLALARLNKHRVPANAIIFQSVLAGAFVAIIFFVAPALVVLGGNAADLATKVYNVVLAAMTLILAASTIFYFVDLFSIHRRDRRAFQQKRIFPMWILWLCIIVGPATCLVVVYDTLANSWIPQLVSNESWWFVVGGLTLFSIIVAAVGSIIATSQAAWEHYGTE